ncbi:cupin domain-containing protein [Ekhidna sp.]|uniref:cupin domain-containing protein n=1 Tax=Ekhidna sp. TaxID=2608089 RepID=UPI0032EC255F
MIKHLTIFTFLIIGFALTTMAQKSESFELKKLLKEAQISEGNYLKFIDNSKLSSGIYELKKGEKDPQQPHEWDELYYVLEGKAQLQVEGKIYEAVPGSVLFVAAKVDHKFINIAKDLKVLVFFSKKE